MVNKPFELSEVTRRTVEYLKLLDKGTLVTYRELATVTGEPMLPARTSYARLMLLRDHNAVWIAVRPLVGLRRLNDREIAERLPNFFLNGARNKLARGGASAEAVELKQLDSSEQTRFAVFCIQRELAFEALSKATTRRMEKVAQGNSNDMPAFTAVEWAISLMPKRRQADDGANTPSENR